MKKDKIEIIREELFELDINRRLKNSRSIHLKLFKYLVKEGGGKYPINKCLNDLLGYRFIFHSDLTLDDVYREIEHYINENYSDNMVKIQNASKLDYKALHIYFKISNQCFPCELQVWLQKDHSNNVKSHRIQKQAYLDWNIYERDVLNAKREGEFDVL